MWNWGIGLQGPKSLKLRLQQPHHMELVRSDTQIVDFLYDLLLHVLQLALHIGHVRRRHGHSLRRCHRGRPSKPKTKTNLPGVWNIDIIGLLYGCMALVNLLMEVLEKVTSSRPKSNSERSKLVDPSSG